MVGPSSNFEDDGHNQRSTIRVLLNKTLEVAADLVLHNAVVAALFGAGLLECARDDIAGVAEEVGVVGCEAASGDFGLAFDLPGALVDRDNRKEDAVFAKVLAVADHGIFNDVGGRVVVDTDAAGRDFASFVGGVRVQGKDVTVFKQKDFLGDPGSDGELDVALQVSVVAMYRNEEFRLDEIDHQAEFFL